MISTEDGDTDDSYNYKQMMARDERRFKRADQNADLFATKEEFTAFLHPEEYDHMKDIVVLVSTSALLCYFSAIKSRNFPIKWNLSKISQSPFSPYQSSCCIYTSFHLALCKPINIFFILFPSVPS